MDSSVELPSDIHVTLYWGLGCMVAIQSMVLRYLYRISRRVDRLTKMVEEGGGVPVARSSRSSSRAESSSQKGSRSSRPAPVESPALPGEDFSRYDGSRRDEPVTSTPLPAREESRQEQSPLFAQFLDEDPARRELTKKEQFEAFRRWRDARGLNWRGS